MTALTQLLACLALVGSAWAFSSQSMHQRRFATQKTGSMMTPRTTVLFASLYNEDEDNFASPAKASMPSFDPNEALASLRNIDVDFSSIQNIDLDSIVENTMEGNLGERGELYFAAQAAIVLCILGGGIPVIGDFLMLLLGPGLLFAGLGVIVVAVGDMGSSLSPWPKATTKGLITDGLFSQMRHPIYAGLLASCAGLSVVSQSATRLLLTVVLLYILDVKTDYEEADLRAIYPEYEDYSQKVTGKFFPQGILDQMPWNN